MFWWRTDSSGERAAQSLENQKFLEAHLADKVDITYVITPTWTLATNFACDPLRIVRIANQSLVSFSDGRMHGTWWVSQGEGENACLTVQYETSHGPQTLKERRFEHLPGTSTWIVKPDDPENQDDLNWSIWLSPLLAPTAPRCPLACLAWCQT